jgi:hypothetical protein
MRALFVLDLEFWMQENYSYGLNIYIVTWLKVEYYKEMFIERGNLIRQLTIKTLDDIIYRQFNIQQFYVLPTQCSYVFRVDLRTNSDYFPIQH